MKNRDSPMHEQVNHFSLVEEIWHAVSHGIGFLLSIAALALLATFAAMESTPTGMVAVSIYGAALMVLFGSSTLYHAVREPATKRFFQKCDHAAIYFLIAGSYTPIMLLTVGGAWGWTLFGVEWGIALVGIFLKFAYPGRFEIFSLAAYLLMGWLIVLVFERFRAHIDPVGFWLIVAGGLAYTGGILFYVKEKIAYFHAVWHLFVMAGAILQFFAILLYVI